MNRRGVQSARVGERRASVRFPIRCAVRYAMYSPGKNTLHRAGQGWTIEISNQCLLFTADAPLPLGPHIELFVDWPAKLDGAIGLNLVISGRVVRTDGNSVVVAFAKHEFRTRGSKGLLSS